MKKYVFSLMAVIVAFVGASFTTQNSEVGSSKSPDEPYFRWFDYNGTNYLGMSDPDNYSPDEDDFPDCYPHSGNIFCEILALHSQYDFDKPNLEEILVRVYKP